jgi:glycerophosphoryl diester phosphodiesterase
MQVIAHRGASSVAPENTKASIQEAFSLHADGVEFDLQMTKDKEIILLHDETLERTTLPYHLLHKEVSQKGSSSKNISEKIYEEWRKTPIEQLLWKDLQNFDVGSWKHGRFKNERLIKLDDVLFLLPREKFFFIEIKGQHHEVIPVLEKIMMKHLQVLSQCIFIGFDFELMVSLKKRNPSWKILALYEGDLLDDEKKLQEEMKKIKQHGLKGLNIEAITTLKNDQVREIHKQGLELSLWVSSQDRAQDTSLNINQCAIMGVNYFTSNMPEDVVLWHEKYRRK